MWNELLERLRRNRKARQMAEHDAPAEMGTPTSRDSGGGSDARTQDTNSSTGTSSNDTFVGRASGDETGDVGLSGGQARTGQEDLDDQGAARDE